MFWQLASMSGFLSFGSCAIGILRNLFAATLPRLPKHPQSYSSCQFLAAKLGRNLWGSSPSSCYQPESIPRISPSLAMKLTAIVTLLVGANALELTKV